MSDLTSRISNFIEKAQPTKFKVGDKVNVPFNGIRIKGHVLNVDPNKKIHEVHLGMYNPKHSGYFSEREMRPHTDIAKGVRNSRPHNVTPKQFKNTADKIAQNMGWKDHADALAHRVNGKVGKNLNNTYLKKYD